MQTVYRSLRIALIFIVLTNLDIPIAHAQASSDDAVGEAARYITPVIGTSRLRNSLVSTGYYNNYTAASDVAVYGGVEVGVRYTSGFSVQSGLVFIRHSTMTDSLNIPPRSSRNIWSNFTMTYNSINVPLRLGYTVLLGDHVALRPDAGLVLRYLWGHDYEEMVMQPDRAGGSMIAPARLFDYENFGVATEVGLSLIGSTKGAISPYVRVSYLRGSSNHRLIRGYESSAIGADQGSTITEKGLLIGVGVNIRI